MLGKVDLKMLHAHRIQFLVVVVFAFFFCWSPFHSQRLMFVLVTLYGSWTKTLTSAQHILFVISGISFLTNLIFFIVFILTSYD